MRYRNTPDKTSRLIFCAALGMTALGCGGDGEGTDDPIGDTTRDSTIGDNPLAKHCPGDFRETDDKPLCIVSSREERYTADNVESADALVWKPEIIYVLKGRIFIGNDADETVLTIEPGTRILGDPDVDPDNASSLIIQRHAKIMAEGTKEAPIVFTSGYEEGSRASEDWGGLVINGNAPINSCDAPPCELTGEGGTGKYGGDDPEDDSGVLAYVRIEFSGRRLTATKEFNGLVLQGVGSGTDIHHIQVHRAGDDNIEFFGGTANVRYLVLSGSGDDYFDWTHGWTGKAQFVVAVPQTGCIDDKGIEADNYETNFDLLPRSQPTLYNFTLPGGLHLRRGTAGDLVNFIIANQQSFCLDIENTATWLQVESGALSIRHSLVPDRERCFEDSAFEGEAWLESAMWETWEGNRVVDDFMLTDPYNETAPDFRPEKGSPALEGAGAPPKGDDFFEAVDFIGGMGEEDWTEGWTDYPVS